MNVFPQKEGLLMLSHPFIGHIVGYNPRMPKKNVVLAGGMENDRGGRNYTRRLGNRSLPP